MGLPRNTYTIDRIKTLQGHIGARYNKPIGTDCLFIGEYQILCKQGAEYTALVNLSYVGPTRSIIMEWHEDEGWIPKDASNNFYLNNTVLAQTFEDYQVVDYPSIIIDTMLQYQNMNLRKSIDKIVSDLTPHGIKFIL